MALNRIIGGAFQDAQGLPLAGGTLVMELCSDEQLTNPLAQIVGGLVIRVPLDNNGNVADTVKVHANDTLNPGNSCYLVDCFTYNGVRAWKSPQYQKVLSSPTPFNINVWVPDANGGCGCGSGQGGGLCPSGILLQTNGVNNGNQCALNLSPGSNITLIDNGLGKVTISSTGGGGGGGSGNFADAEIPGGLVNSINNSFTLLNAPNPAKSLILVQDGLTLRPGSGSGFTLSGLNITTTSPPIADFVAWYRF